jgi:DNA-binding IclR family transcriptional regulator
MAFVNQVPGAQRLQAVSAVGDRFPLHCSANGKAALAMLPPEQVRKVLRGRLQVHTRNTMTDFEMLARELDHIRQSGIAVDLEEHTLGICALGMAFRDKAHQIYAVSMPIPAVRFAEQRKTCEAALRDTVERLTTLL